MNGGLKEKLKLEELAIDVFLKHYNSFRDDDLRVLEHRDRPDFLVQNLKTKEKVGVEITHLFYDDEEAKMVFGRPYKRIDNEFDFNELIFVLNHRLIDKTQDAKDYDFIGQIILAIRVASPAFDKYSFDLYEKDIIIPEKIFSEIWLVFHDGIKLLDGKGKKIVS